MDRPPVYQLCTDYTMADDGFSIRIPYAKITAE